VSMTTGTAGAAISVRVGIAGEPLAPSIFKYVTACEVESSLFLPSQMRLAFRAATDDTLTKSGLKLGVKVRVAVSVGGVPKPIFTGEVTGVDLELGPEGRMAVVRALDPSHRLMHGTVIDAYPDMTASDVVAKIVGQYQVEVGEIEPTKAPYTWLSQPSVSPWVFVQQLAQRENRVAYVDALGLFNFKAMPKAQDGPPPVMSYDQKPLPTQMVAGRNLIRLRSSVTGAEQVEGVVVTGYDTKASMKVVGVGEALGSTAEVTDPGVEPAVVGGEMKGAKKFYDAARPVDSEGEASNMAASIAADIAGALAEIEGQCYGNPSVLSGEVISIGMAGQPFDGQYVCSAVRHCYEPGNGGYTTWFTVGGRRDRTLAAMVSGRGYSDLVNQGRVPGLVVGTVDDNKDPEQSGRVKVTFPWLSDSYKSAWARTMQIGAGKTGEWGFLFVPEVGEEVLVGFDRGDIDHPFVIGNLYKGIGKPKPEAQITDVVASRRITSRAKHTLLFDDGPDTSGITIKSGLGNVTIKLDEKAKAITIECTDGTVTVKGNKGITLEATSGNLELKAADGQVSVTGKAGVALTSEGKVSASGSDVGLNAKTSATIQAPSVSVSSQNISLGG